MPSFWRSRWCERSLFCGYRRHDNLKILDHDSKIKFYRDDDNNIYADTVTGFNIAALSFLGGQRITGVPSFDPQNYTEITPI